MENNSNNEVELVYGALQEVYDDCGISEHKLREFAEILADDVFIGECPLNDILDSVYYFEEEMRADDIEITIGRQCAVYGRLLSFLERNESNARRLYESFLFYHDSKAFYLLMEDFEEWLSKEERDEVLSIAKDTFIPFVWECYV